MQEIKQQKKAPAAKRPPPEKVEELIFCSRLFTYDTNVDYTPAAIAFSSPDPGGGKVFHPGRLKNII